MFSGQILKILIPG